MIENCKTFYEMLDTIEDVGSSIVKEQYIKYTLEHVKNAEIFFRLVFNDTVYGINEQSFYNALKMKGITPHPDTSFPHVSDFLIELEYIGEDKVTKKIPELIAFADDLKNKAGNFQLELLYSFFVNIPDIKKKWWCRAILHDLRMGANVKTVNSVFKELGLKEIPKFAMMLAKKTNIYDPADVARRIKFPCVMERKYNGLRLEITHYDDVCILMSRRGKDRTEDFPEIVEAIDRKFEGQSVKLDGEIVKCYDGNTESFQGIMKKDNKGIRKYICFDLLVDENLDYKYRWSNLEMLWGSTPVEDLLLLADHYDCNRIEEAQEYFEALIEDSREGIMLKQLDSCYVRGSRNYMCKCKPDYVPSMQAEHEADLLITGWKYGEGKNHDRVGTLCLQDRSGKIIVDVGSGINDSQREMLTKRKDELKGMICEIRYNEKTETGSLHFPRYITLREDKDEADDLST